MALEDAAVTPCAPSRVVSVRRPFGSVLNCRVAMRGRPWPGSHRRTVAVIAILCTSRPAVRGRDDMQVVRLEAVRRGLRGRSGCLWQPVVISLRTRRSCARIRDRPQGGRLVLRFILGPEGRERFGARHGPRRQFGMRGRGQALSSR